MRRKDINNSSYMLPLKALWYDYRKNARRKGLDFTLTLTEFETLTSSKCVYCGIDPVKPFNDYGRFIKPYMCNGIDRINNAIGYISSNVVTCCKDCNFAKGTKSQDEFLEWIKRIVSWQSMH